jgi:superfamily II DNA or RNA helicase
LYLKVNNNRTEIVHGEEWMVNLLSKEMRYPSPLAQFDSDGITIPTDENGWDGWVRLLQKRVKMNSYFPTGLLPMAVRLCDKFGCPVSVDDRRVRPEEAMPELIDIPLREYQKAAADKALAIGRGVLDMPPRSGKTRTMCEIVRRVALPTLWIAPTDRIVKQTRETIAGFFGKNFALQLIGSKKVEDAFDVPVVVATAATAARLPPEFYETRGCISVDEFHHAAAKQYDTIFRNCDHIFYRYGMTGTFFRSGQDALAMHGHLSNTIYKVTSGELLRRGYLVPANVVFIPVFGPKVGRVDTTFQRGHGKYGIQEHFGRNQLVAQCALTLYRRGRRVLILVGTKKQGREIQRMLLRFVPSSPNSSEFESVEFVSTDKDRSAQGRILESFDRGEEVKILLGTSLLGEGVDMPSTDALVYARGEQAEVGLTQSMYRVSTAVEGKPNAIVVDFADRHHKKLMAHSMERLRVYYEEETFGVSVLQDIREFESWLNLCQQTAA